MSLFGEKGRLYAVLGDENSEIPEELKEFAEDITFYDWIPNVVRRETGVYRFETAEAELETDQMNKQLKYKVQMRAKNMDDIRTLLRKIKTGTIRPDESYECAQGGKTRQQLEAEATHWEQQYGDANFELELVQALLKEVEADYLEYRNQFAGHVSDLEKLAKVRTLADNLRSDNFWPLCYKSRIADQIGAILDSK
jgi:hypothetical protein